MSVRSARAALKTGFAIRAADGREYRFTERLVGKYLSGSGRSQGADVDRLHHLPRAMEAVAKANGGMRLHPNDNPPQRSFLHRFDNGHAALVFADASSGEIRSFIYSSRPGKLERKHSRIK